MNKVYLKYVVSKSKGVGSLLTDGTVCGWAIRQEENIEMDKTADKHEKAADNNNKSNYLFVYRFFTYYIFLHHVWF